MSSLTQQVLHYIEVRDHRIMHRVHHWRAPRWVRLWMICATRGGDGWVWFALAAALMMAGGPEALRTVGQAFAAVGAGIGLFLILKRTTGRRRPCALEPHCWATLLPPDQFSFPSGHTITAFAVAVPVAAHYPGLGAGLYFLALSVAASRVILGMHFLSDVIAGAVLGGLLGHIALVTL